MLLSGDLLDSDNTYYETGEELIRCLQKIPVPVFIAPGNHDYYSSKSPYARLELPENVHIFTENEIVRSSPCRSWRARLRRGLYRQARPPAAARLSRPRGRACWNLLCLHGEVGARDSKYDPITEEELAASGVDYAALGHIHKASGLKKAGDTWYAWPGCPEGRGFDETGEKTVSIVELGRRLHAATPVSVASRRYEMLRVDVTGATPAGRPHLLPDETVRDVYRITLTGETDESPDLARLRAISARCFSSCSCAMRRGCAAASGSVRARTACAACSC